MWIIFTSHGELRSSVQMLIFLVQLQSARKRSSCSKSESSSVSEHCYAPQQVNALYCLMSWNYFMEAATFFYMFMISNFHNSHDFLPLRSKMRDIELLQDLDTTLHWPFCLSSAFYSRDFLLFSFVKELWTPFTCAWSHLVVKIQSSPSLKWRVTEICLTDGIMNAL